VDVDDFEHTPMLTPLETSQSTTLTQKPMSLYSFLQSRRFSVGLLACGGADVGRDEGGKD
jgi:hypothetical protein